MPELFGPGVFQRVAARREALRHVEWSFELFPAQREIAEDPHPIRIVANGRRWGKSFLASVEAVEEANHAQGTVLLTANTYKQAKHGMWQHLVTNLEPKFRKVHQGDMRIELLGGGQVQVGSLDEPDNLRGMGADIIGIIVDEAAFTTDYALESVLQPMMLDRNAWLLGISTPKGRGNWFHRYWLRGQSGKPEDGRYKSWQMPTWTNPCLKHVQTLIDDLRNTIPSTVFEQEYEAKFVDDVGAVFRGVQLCEVATRPVKLNRAGLPILPPGNYYVGIDFARSGNDYTVVYVLDKTRSTGSGQGDLKTVWIGRWGRLEDEKQVDLIAAILKHFKPTRVLAEKNSFGGVYMSWMASRHKLAVELFDTTGTSKGPLVLQLAGALEFGRLDLWPETDELGRVVVNELLAYQSEQTEAKHTTYSAPDGFHDDCVIALALAVRAAEGEPEGEPAGTFEGDFRDYLVGETYGPSRGVKGILERFRRSLPGHRQMEFGAGLRLAA